MNLLLAKVLSHLATPVAAMWVAHHEIIIRVKGRPLSPVELQHAKSLPIENPDLIRVLEVPRIPSGLPRLIENFLRQLGYPAGCAAGMCLRHGIYIHRKHAANSAVLHHELVHTAQYQQFGSLENFLQTYIFQCLHWGYQNAPMEREARSRP